MNEPYTISIDDKDKSINVLSSLLDNSKQNRIFLKSDNSVVLSLSHKIIEDLKDKLNVETYYNTDIPKDIKAKYAISFISNSLFENIRNILNNNVSVFNVNMCDDFVSLDVKYVEDCFKNNISKEKDTELAIAFKTCNVIYVDDISKAIDEMKNTYQILKLSSIEEFEEIKSDIKPGFIYDCIALDFNVTHDNISSIEEIFVLLLNHRLKVLSDASFIQVVINLSNEMIGSNIKSEYIGNSYNYNIPNLLNDME